MLYSTLPATIKDARTHTDTGYTVLGHKVLLQTGKEKQTKNIMNSNTDNSIYLMAKLNEDGTLTILNVNTNKGHKISTEINWYLTLREILFRIMGKRADLIHING
jgi:hypothetical protein